MGFFVFKISSDWVIYLFGDSYDKILCWILLEIKGLIITICALFTWLLVSFDQEIESNFLPRNLYIIIVWPQIQSTYANNKFINTCLIMTLWHILIYISNELILKQRIKTICVQKALILFMIKQPSNNLILTSYSFCKWCSVVEQLNKKRINVSGICFLV